MTTERKILYVLGVIIIAGMIAIGSFSLGVYVGKQGWTIKEPSVIGPEQGVDQRPDGVQSQPQQGNQNLPPKPELIGRVMSINPSVLELNTVDGLRSILISDDTIILWQGEGLERSASLSDIKIGNHLAVIGEFSEDGRSLTAVIIIQLKPKQ